MNGALRFYNETSIYLVHWIPFAPRLRSSLDAIAWGLRARTDPPDIVVSAPTARECLEELGAEAKRRGVEVQMWSPFRPNSSIPWYECWWDIIGPLGGRHKPTPSVIQFNKLAG